MDAVLSQLAESVASARDLETLTRPLLELLESVTGMESTYLTSIDAEADAQQVLYAYNTQTLQIPEGLTVTWSDTLCKRALEEDHPYADDVETRWRDSAAARALGIKTYVSQPVRNLDGSVCGTLCAASDRRVELAPRTLKLLTMFATLIAHQIERERLLERLQRENQELSSHALIDPLTGIANRRALQQELRRMLARAARDGGNVQLAFIDLDGFKAINDRYGHEIGDRFLMFIAGKLVAGTRVGDIVARLGGDEFVVAASSGDADNLRERVEALTAGRFHVDDIIIDYRGASVGLAVSVPGESEPDALLMRGDAAMYAIKHARHAARA
ncbi:sensor domain-containing diguanylate cyclase [Solimonas marina]|uniref:diguanylate cyclase n=1 Tax=Solimonas marina TaxID=2714601 RepID=A0A969W6R2_9GAMM|nr:sensor domain-containing diguanylate cyclase [Solimonas marina]NKF20968.1 sensor domain-containing diguanylate cyclase [Solimonas marina]